jgi:hypothetical protein
MNDLRFPIGKMKLPAEVTTTLRKQYLNEIAAAPARLRAAVQGLSDDQLDTPYRTDGWTVRQVVHHVPDSHLNSYVRCKWALTEAEPLIKTYDHDGWSTLADARTAPIEMSLTLLDVLHERWLFLLNRLDEDDFARTFKHPEWGLVRLDQNLAIYAWHGKHHVAHITGLREREGW